MLASNEDLEVLEERVLAALDRPPQATQGDLPVIGHGEITLVLGCPVDEPSCVAKRLPPFVDRHRAEAYGSLIREYVGELRRRGIECVHTEYRVIETSGGWAAYVLQPELAPAEIGPAALRARESFDPGGEAVRELLGRIVDLVVMATDNEVGLDAQLSNWADTAQGLRYFDVSTPLLADSHGATRMDLQTLTSPLPGLMRWFVRRFMAPSIISAYHSPRSVLVDLAANLHKERLARWVPAVVVAANAHLDVPISPAEVTDHYRRDARTWEAMLRLRKADRWMHRNLLRRRYGTLLPPSIDR